MSFSLNSAGILKLIMRAVHFTIFSPPNSFSFAFHHSLPNPDCVHLQFSIYLLLAVTHKSQSQLFDDDDSSIGADSSGGNSRRRRKKNTRFFVAAALIDCWFLLCLGLILLKISMTARLMTDGLTKIDSDRDSIHPGGISIFNYFIIDMLSLFGVCVFVGWIFLFTPTKREPAYTWLLGT